MTDICPCCGYNLKADEVVERDGWRLDPRGDTTFNGVLVTSRRTWTTTLLALARANGRPLTTEVLLSRISESENPNTFASTICQLRREIARQGLRAPFETAGKSGYRWRCAA